jgi:hypothetical protein
MPILLSAAIPNPKRAQDSPTSAAEANRNFGRTAALWQRARPWAYHRIPGSPLRGARMTFRQYRHHRADTFFIAALNFARPCTTNMRLCRHRSEITFMKIALLALLGLVLGVLGAAALGIGAGPAWAEIFNSAEGDSGMLVFFTFMPLGAVIGGLGGALLFSVMAIRDAEIAIEKEPAPPRRLGSASASLNRAHRFGFVQA